MKQDFKIILASIVLLLTTIQVASCSFLDLSDGCGNEVIQEIVSPDKRLKAVIFQRDCGATTDFSTQVSILDAGEKLPPQGGNVFVCDSSHGKAPAGAGGGPPVEVTWIANDALKIIHDTDARIFFAANKYKNAEIVYGKKDF